MISLLHVKRDRETERQRGRKGRIHFKFLDTVILWCSTNLLPNVAMLIIIFVAFECVKQFFTKGIQTYILRYCHLAVSMQAYIPQMPLVALRKPKN
jgi:hypothetical protein